MNKATIVLVIGCISFDFCSPPLEEVLKNTPTANLGQVLLGDRIRPSVYKVLVFFK